MMDYLLKRIGFWGGKFLSQSFFFNNFSKPLVFLDTLVLERSQYWPQDQIRDIQWRRIQHLLRTAYTGVPFWRAHLGDANVDPVNLKTWADFQRIPVIQKGDLRGKPFEAIADQAVPSYWLFRDSTSGSTGVPFQFVVDRSFVLRGLAFCQRMFRMLGQKSSDTFVRFSASNRPGLNWGNYFFRIPHDDALPDRVDEFSRVYADQTLIIYGNTSYLIELAKLLSRKRHSVRFRVAIASGEMMTDIQKRFIEERLNCPVSRCYTTRELGWIAQECLAGGFHVNSEWCYIEIVDEKGAPLPPGENGRIIVTTFDNEVMPFIRYDTGDTGEILLESCSCGRTLPLIRLLGRKVGILHLPGGRTLHHFYLVPFFQLRADKIKKFQIIQEAIDRVKVKIVPDSLLSLLDIQLLKGQLLDIIGTGIDFSIELVDSISKGPRGKDVLFLSKLDEPR